MKCPALGCNNDHRLHKSLMWHRFPLRRPLLLAKWTVKLKPNLNFEHRRLCAIHFHKDCYVRTNDEQKPLKLRRNAYPTLFEGEQIDDNYLLDESLANVEDKSVPPTTVRKRDVAEYKKKKELQQRQGQSGDVVDLDGNIAFFKDDEEDNDDNNLLLAGIKQDQSSPLHTVESPSPSSATRHHNNHGSEPSAHALLSMAQLQHTQNMFDSSFDAAGGGTSGGPSESFFNALNDTFSPQERQNTNSFPQDVQVWAKQFMADTLVAGGIEQQQQQQQSESSTSDKRTIQEATSATPAAKPGALTGAAKRKAAHVTRLGAAASASNCAVSTRSMSNDIASVQSTKAVSGLLPPPHMKKTNSISSNSGSSSPNSPLSTVAVAAAGNASLPSTTGADPEIVNLLRTIDNMANSGTATRSAAAAASAQATAMSNVLANALLQNPSIAATLGTQLMSAMASAGHNSNNVTQHTNVRGGNNANDHSTISSSSSAKRKLPASTAQQQQQQMPSTRPSKTPALQSAQSEMLPNNNNNNAYGNNNNNGIMTRSASNNMQLVQQVYNVLLKSMPNGFNSSNNNNNNNNNLMPNLHVLASNLASVVAQNSHFNNNNNNGTGVVMGNGERRELDRLAREIESLRRQLSSKDNELQEMRNSAGSSGGKQPAFALIPLGTNNVSLASLARFLQTCGCGDGSIGGGVGNHTNDIANNNNGDDTDGAARQFDIQEMQCSVNGNGYQSHHRGSTNASSSGYHGMQQQQQHHGQSLQHFLMPSLQMNGGNDTLTGYELKH